MKKLVLFAALVAVASASAVLAQSKAPVVHIEGWEDLTCKVAHTNPVIRLYPAERRVDVRCE
jgi:hypothetical protein